MRYRRLNKGTDINISKDLLIDFMLISNQIDKKVGIACIK